MRAAQVLGCAAFAAGLVAVGSELAGTVWGPAIAVAMVAVLVSLIMIGVSTRGVRRAPDRSARLALVIGVVTVPAILIGGLLSILSERFLEVPLLALGCMWIWLGGLMLHTPIEDA